MGATAVVAVAAMAAVDSTGMDVASSTSNGSALQHVSGCIGDDKLCLFGCLHPTGSSHCKHAISGLIERDDSQEGTDMDAIYER